MKRVVNKFWGRMAVGAGAMAALLVGSVACSVKAEDALPYDAYLLYKLLDSPKYLFVTSATYNGNLQSAGNAATGVAGADALCAADSRAAGAIYKALLVDGTNRIACTSANCATSGVSEHTNWVVSANREYRRFGSTTIVGTTNSVGLFAFPLTNAFHTSGQWWTGLRSNWTSAAPGVECADWSTTNPVANGSAGSPQVDTRAIDTGVTFEPFCNETASLVCVQQ